MAIWPDHVEIVRAFLAVWSQWRTSVIVTPMGAGGIHYQGLDYAGARAGLKGDGFTITPTLWRGVRTMEAEAKTVLNARS